MKFQEKNPSNARIFIDYTNKNNPVKFEYPNKKSAFRIAFITLLGLWVKLTILLMILAVPFIFIFAIMNGSGVFSQTAEEIGGLVLAFVLLVAYFSIPPLIGAVAIHKNERLVYKLPQVNKWVSGFPFGGHYYIEKHKLNSKVFTLPVFNNVFLDYRVTGDFARYLQRVRITEYEFKYWKQSLIKKRRELVEQDDTWKAKFFFKEVPKKGKLQIWFD